MPVKNAVEIVQEIINMQKRPFMTVKNLALVMGAQLRRQLGLEDCKTSAEIKRALEPLLGGKFIFHKKGAFLYILVPCDPVDLVRTELSTEQPKGAAGIASVLPYSKADVSRILNHLLDTGEAKLILSENLATRIIATGHKAADTHEVYEFNSESESEPEPESKAQQGLEQVQESNLSFSQKKFINALRELDNGNYFVKIFALRQKLNWPREVFDDMLRELRDKEIIQMHIADTTLMTPDEVNDCFIDENNYRMGTVTLNAR
ncbi:MAG: hypothetical protein IJP48_05060 [Synergistaceae bacterium]|nr:hypothetical protein [Synergistaceae bacterium]